MSFPETLKMPTTRSVKLDGELLDQIKLIVLARNLGLAPNEERVGISDYLDDVVRPAVARDYPKALKAINEHKRQEGNR